MAKDGNAIDSEGGKREKKTPKIIYLKLTYEIRAAGARPTHMCVYFKNRFNKDKLFFSMFQLLRDLMYLNCFTQLSSFQKAIITLTTFGSKTWLLSLTHTHTIYTLVKLEKGQCNNRKPRIYTIYVYLVSFDFVYIYCESKTQSEYTLSHTHIIYRTHPCSVWHSTVLKH